MSAFRPSPGAGGPVLTPEQLAQLVDDTELSAAEVAIIAAGAADHASTRTAIGTAREDVKTHSTGEATATRTLVGTVRDAITDAITATRDAVEGFVNAARDLVRSDIAALPTPASPAAVAAVKADTDALKATAATLATEHTATRSLLGNVRDAVLAALNSPYQLQTVLTDDGLPPAGKERVSGIFAPTTLFGQQNWVVTRAPNTTPTAFNSTQALRWVPSGSWLYSFTTGQNATPPALALVGTTVMDANAAYSIGGSTSTVSTAIVRLTLATVQSDNRAPLNTARGSAAVGQFADGTVLVVGGVPASGPFTTANSLASMEKFDPAANTCTPVGDFPVRCYAGRSLLLANGDLMFFFSANSTTTDQAGTAVSAAVRAFRITPALEVTELESIAVSNWVYQRADGRLVANTSTAGAVKVHNLDAPDGGVDLPGIVPPGITLFAGSVSQFRTIAGGWQPVSLSSALHLLGIDNPPPPAQAIVVRNLP